MGFIGYTVTDFAYLFADAMGTYEANAFIDTFYVVSIVTLGIGSFAEWHNPTIKYNPEPHDTPQNVGSNYRIISFMIVPIVLYYLGIMEPFAFFPLVLFLVLYMILGMHIQKAILSEGLLISERIITEKLEQIVEDRTRSLRASYDKINKLAITDSLSGLYNRRHFMEHLDQLILSNESAFHLYYLDLDHFKVINDVHGYEMGFIPPDVFIPISESTGSIIRLGKWIIKTVFSQMKDWESRFNKPLKVGINLSPLQFDSLDFFPFITEQIKAYGIDAGLVEFEITD